MDEPPRSEPARGRPDADTAQGGWTSGDVPGVDQVGVDTNGAGRNGAGRNGAVDRSERWVRTGHRMPPRRSVWELFVPVVALAAGVLFATSANLARGTDLRSQGTGGLVGLVRAAQGRVAAAQSAVSALDAAIKAQTDKAAGSNSGVAAQRSRLRALQKPAGLTALRGPGLVVVLDDSHTKAPAGVDANESVVHQSDLQAVINALWAGGAEAVSIAGQRLIATSAVRCVGNTLLLNGEVYSPPFRVVAIGPADRMRAALGRSPGVKLYRQAAAVLGLRYSVDSSPSLRVPAYTGPSNPTSARVPR